MSTYALRQLLVEIAARDVGVLETSRNRGTEIKKFWPATDYPEGYQVRAPYCAAACCYWVREWLRLPAVQAAFGKSPAALEKWRCKSPAAFGWLEWAKQNKLLILSDSMESILHTGDLFVFDMSHLGVVVTDSGAMVSTIEANTGEQGGNDGEGIFAKTRNRAHARGFIRLLA
jgi:hypothetical protein